VLQEQTEALNALMGFGDCTSQLDVHVEVKQLQGRDGLFSKSDPFCVLLAEVDGQWNEVGRTEIAINQHGA